MAVVAPAGGPPSFITLPTDLQGLILQNLPIERFAFSQVCKEYNAASHRNGVFTEQHAKDRALIILFQRVCNQHVEMANFVGGNPMNPNPSYPLNARQFHQYLADITSGAGKIREWMLNPLHQSCLLAVTEIDLSSQNLRVAPSEISLFRKVNVLNLSNNLLTTLPKELDDYEGMYPVKLENNKFSELRIVVVRLLLILSVACAILSLIPPLQFVGSIALRGVGAFTGCTLVISALQRKSFKEASFTCVKIAPVILGLMGLILGSPLLIYLSFSLDISFKLMEIIKTRLYDKSKDLESFEKILLNSFFIALNILGLAAMLTGYWQIMAAAASLSALTMLIIFLTASFKSKTVGDRIDNFSYFAFCALSIVSAIMVSEIRAETFSKDPSTHKSVRETYIAKTPYQASQFPTLPLFTTSIVTDWKNCISPFSRYVK